MSNDNMYLNGQYLKNNPTWGMEDAAWKSNIIQQLIERNDLPVNEITEVGCGAGGILENLAKKNSNIQSLKGYDISPQAIALAKQQTTQQIQFFQEDLTDKQIYTDLLLIIDVIEHVQDFYDFLNKLKPKSSFFIFHIPLDLSCRTILKPHVLLQQRESVGHIHYFSQEMVWWFLKDTGYEIIDWVYTKPVTDVNRADSFKRFIKKWLRNFSFFLNKDLSAKLWGGYSMMILAK